MSPKNFVLRSFYSSPNLIILSSIPWCTAQKQTWRNHVKIETYHERRVRRQQVRNSATHYRTLDSFPFYHTIAPKEYTSCQWMSQRERGLVPSQIYSKKATVVQAHRSADCQVRICTGKTLPLKQAHSISHFKCQLSWRTYYDGEEEARKVCVQDKKIEYFTVNNSRTILSLIVGL